MSKPTLCVIVPVYKAAATLDRCVASVLAQQVAGGLHCILVDDGSPDESGGLCDAWAARDPRVTILHQENRGVSAARNAGLAAADSEYLVFLDADDALRPGALQAALDAQNTAPQSFVLWHYTTDEQDAAAVTSDTATRPQNMLARLWLDCLLAMPWNKLYRTAPAQQLAFNRQYTLGEDLQFVLDYIDLLGRTAPDFAYTILTAPLTFYDCSREGTLSTKYHADYCKIWPEHFARLNKACYAAHCPQEDMRPLHRAELTVYAEGVADILRREVGAVFAQVQTDADGRFAIDGIAPGVYSLAYDLKEGTQAARLGDSTFTTEGSQLVMTEIEISENNNYTAPMLGLKIDTSIGGMVWCDNAGEIAPLSGAEVILLDEKGSELQTATTGEDGIYRFDGLMPGNYRLRVTLPNGYVVVEKDDTRLKDGQNISVMTTYTAREGESDLIALRMSQHQLEQNIGAVQPGTLGDFCWLDLNGNGLQDAGELGLGDMRIELWRNDQLVAETTTDAYGYYTFENLYPGVYTLKPIYPTEVVPTRMRTDIPLIASILGENGESNPVQVTSASTTYTADLGFVLVDDDVLPANYGIGEKQDWTKK